MPHNIIVVVTGGRDYEDEDARKHVYQVLDDLNPALVMHGACRLQGYIELSGADRLADDWSARRDVDCYRIPAKWVRYGTSAGPKRNKELLDKAVHQSSMLAGGGEPWPIYVVAFPGGKGTQHCVEAAEDLGIQVIDKRGEP